MGETGIVPGGGTLGHESVGVIDKLGSAVTGFQEGQRVTVCAVTPCYRCSYCQRGFTSQCAVRSVATANLTLIPDELSDAQAVCTCDMLTTGFMGANLMGAGRIIAVESRP